MFDFNAERNLLLEENERKPNRYMAVALWIGFGTLFLSLLLNEADLFHVDKTIMRVCTLVSLLSTVTAQAVAANRTLCENRKGKYVALACACVMTFTYGLALFIFATPLCILPMLLAVQYNSRKMSLLAIGGSALCVALTPPLGCVMGLWDDQFLLYLLSMTRRAQVALTPEAPMAMSTIVASAAAYVSFPWLMSVLTFSKLILSATKKGEENIGNQIKILQMSRRDSLTGLFNQNVYRQFLESDPGDGKMGVLFFDVDGLKSVNDTGGHERGDLLLKRCAESLFVLFDEACHGFRVGGDEFLVVIDTPDPAIPPRKLELWKSELERINRENETLHGGILCHMSAGMAYGEKASFHRLISEADKKMYEAKRAYHETTGKT